MAGSCNQQLVLGNFELNPGLISTFPNTFSDILQVASPQFVKRFNIYNSTGQLVVTSENIGTWFSVPGNELKSGAYFLQFETQFGCSFVRVIKID